MPTRRDTQQIGVRDEYDGCMVRFVIIGIVIAVAFTLYALVDAAMTEGSRARGVPKPVWVVLVVVLPVIGGVLWFLIGKGDTPAVRPAAPDDDPRFTGTRMSTGDLDSHMQDLEARLRELDSETFPGEDRTGRGSTAAPEGPASGKGTPPQANDAGTGDAGTDAPDRRDGDSRTDGDAAQQ